jgi:hypothetical protein
VYPGPFEDYGKGFEHHGWTPFNYGDQDLGLLEISFAGPPIFSLLMTHRDGQRWRVASYDTRVLQIGPKGAMDDLIVAVTCNPPFVVDGGRKLRFYYNGRHGVGETKERTAGLFAAEMRLDGFAGMTVDNVAVQRYKQPAVLQTQLLAVTQEMLQLNIANHRQSAQVALLDESLKAITGYDVGDCLPIDEDNPRAAIRWKDHADVSALKGHNVHVLVKLSAGTIYSVRV